MDSGAFSAFFHLISDVASTLIADKNVLMVFGILLGLGVIGGIFSIIKR